MPHDSRTATTTDDQSHLRLQGDRLIREAGKALAGWLEADPLQIDAASPLELAVVEHAMNTTFLKRVDHRAAQLEREARQAESAAKPREKYPTLSIHSNDT